jgi:hypothetical protein
MQNTKRPKRPKFELQVQTVRPLDSVRLSAVAGGGNLTSIVFTNTSTRC